ncbi:MAG: sigma 54-interacting transcriptional regulator [Myxococcales bacterium]|nr:sigma 54-interacting transcriptional regulator [Myxococcales bacterium]
MAKELEGLAAIARLLAASSDLDEVLGPVLRVLGEELGLHRVALCRVDADAGEVLIEAAHGLTPAEIRRGRYRVGEGVIGEVAATGQPARVPRISRDARYLNRTGAIDADQELGYVCVPVVHGERVIGVLAAYRPSGHASRLRSDVHRLTLVATLLIPAMVQSSARAPNPTTATGHAARTMIGRSKEIRQVFTLVTQVADSPTTVLLRGESGTGKELVAKALHEDSPRRRGPMVKVNCAALPESVIESELFGHERGAFTGAVAQRRGRFELADGGTIFLDEIGDLSPATQIKLLRVLQERELQRVGSNQTVRVDVRIIAATSRPLEEMVQQDTFRKDLYYRLNVFPIHLPALRERRADVVLLADHFVEVFNRSHGRSVRRLSTPVIDMLMAYHWPGNVRELENCMERAVLLARDDVIHGHHLPPSLQTAEASDTGVRGGLKGQLESVERELVLDALKSARGNMAEAARQLQITERIMGLRVAKYGIQPLQFRDPTKM